MPTACVTCFHAAGSLIVLVTGVSCTFFWTLVQLQCSSMCCRNPLPISFTLATLHGCRILHLQWVVPLATVCRAAVRLFGASCSAAPIFIDLPIFSGSSSVYDHVVPFALRGFDGGACAQTLKNLQTKTSANGKWCPSLRCFIACAHQSLTFVLCTACTACGTPWYTYSFCHICILSLMHHICIHIACHLGLKILSDFERRHGRKTQSELQDYPGFGEDSAVQGGQPR